MILLYLWFGLLCIGLAALAWLLVVRWGALRGGAAALIVAVVAVACWPIPIHGGFMLLGEVFFSELDSLTRQRGHERARRRDEAFIEAQAARFAGPLSFTPGERVAPGWKRGRTAAGAPLWLDERSGLVWSELLLLAPAEPADLLVAARSRCAALAPTGHWALPSDAEGYMIWRHGGLAVLPRRSGRVVSARVDTQLGLALPVVRVQRGSDASDMTNTGRDTALPWWVRCVARGPEAPARGYLDLDIPRDDWNAYQLAKLQPQAR